MISYTALILGSIGTIWTIFILSRMLVRKKTRPRKSVLKSIVKQFVPFNAQSYPRDSLEFLFAQALRTLQIFIPSSNYKYHLPWYAAIGQEGVGKTTFFKSLQLESPIDSQEFCSDQSLCYWHFFNSGVFLDLKGELVRKDGNVPISNEQDWMRVLDLINKTRSSKGLDGLLVFLSVEDFIGAGAKTESELAQDAEYMYAKLWQLQKILQLKLPIYVVFTHLDSITGFDEFSKAIPANLLQDIFGWSNPYSLDSSFQGTWIDNMFDSMNERIEQIQGEIFVVKDQECNARVLEFFANYRKLASALKLYMERLFQANTYAEGYFLRGIYFVGAQDNIAAGDKGMKWPKNPANEHVGHKNKSNIAHYVRHLFATNIVTKKIFLEKNLGRLIGGASASYRLKLKLLQFAIAGLSISGVVYLSQAYIKLENAMSVLNPRVAKVVRLMNEHKNPNLQLDHATLMQEAQQLLNAIINVSSVNLRFAFIPTSWVSTLEYRLWKLLEQSNDLIIVKAICKRMEEKYRNLAQTELSDITKEQQDEISSLANPLEHPTYIKLHNYIGKMVELNQIQQKFISASENGNVHSFAWLIKHLIGIEIPSKFYNSTRVFTEALKDNSITVANLQNYQAQIKKNAEILFDNFIKQAFVLHNFIENFNELQQALYVLENNQKSFTINNLSLLSNQLSGLITFINSREFTWIQHRHLNLKKYIGLMQHVEQLPILGREFQKSVMLRVDQQFNMLKATMQAVKLPVVGSVFYLDADNRLKVTDTLMELQGLLNGLFSEKFMQDCEQKELSKVQYGKTIIWNADILNSISDIFVSYDEFMAKKVQLYPANLVKMLRVVGKQNMDRIVKCKLADAQQNISVEYSMANIVVLSENIKASYAGISSILKRMKGLDMSTYDQLIEIEKKRCLQVVEQAEEMLDSEGLYTIDLSNIQMDHLLNGKLYFSMNLQDYISTQRTKIMYFAKDVIEPVIKTLLFIDSLDSSTMTSKVQKWANIVKDVDGYNAQNQSSNLYKLESFIKEFESLKPEQLNEVLKNQGQLKVTDRVVFKFRLANQSGMSFLPINDRAYSVGSQDITIILGKQEFVKMLLQNGVTKAGQTVLKFEFAVVDASANRKLLVFAVPVELVQEDGAVLALPDVPLSALAKSLKV